MRYTPNNKNRNTKIENRNQVHKIQLQYEKERLLDKAEQVSLSHTHSLSHSHSLSLAHSHSLTLTLSHSHSLTLSLSHSLTLSLTLKAEQVCHARPFVGANLKSISHRCHPILVAVVWDLTKETINLPLGCLHVVNHSGGNQGQVESFFSLAKQYGTCGVS